MSTEPTPLKKAQERFRRSLSLVFNVNTPEGTQIAIQWMHIRLSGERVLALVLAETRDLAERKAIEFEIDAMEVSM